MLSQQEATNSAPRCTAVAGILCVCVQSTTKQRKERIKYRLGTDDSDDDDVMVGFRLPFIWSSKDSQQRTDISHNIYIYIFFVSTAVCILRGCYHRTCCWWMLVLLCCCAHDYGTPGPCSSMQTKREGAHSSGSAVCGNLPLSLGCVSGSNSSRKNQTKITPPTNELPITTNTRQTACPLTCGTERPSPAAALRSL